MNLATVTVRQRLPYARVLAASYLANHPDGQLYVLVLDGNQDLFDLDLPGIRLLDPASAGIAEAELSKLAMLYGSKDLVSALVPLLIGRLLQDLGEPVLYLADDTKVFSSLDAIEHEVLERGVLLAPRSPIASISDGRFPDQTDVLEAGIFESGFAAIAPSHKELAVWWWDALSSKATALRGADVVRPGRVLDSAALYFDLRPFRDRGCCVSFWNVDSRPLEKDGDGYRIEGNALSLFRFEGYDPDKPHLLSVDQGSRPRVLLSERSDLLALTTAYSRNLQDAGFDDAAKLIYGFEKLACGIEVDDRMRRLFGRALKNSIQQKEPSPPDPFDNARPLDFLEWLNSPDPKSLAPLVSRYLFDLYETRPDLHLAFPGIQRPDVNGFLEWVEQYGVHEATIPAELVQLPYPALSVGLPAAPPSDSLRVERNQGAGLAGVNVAGYFKAELGLGEMARLILLGLEDGGIPYSTYSYGATFSRQESGFVSADQELAHDVNLICVNADQLEDFVRNVGRQFLENRYNIGLWWWEVEQFPATMAKAAAYLDEIWVGSEHVASAISAAIDKPVLVAPLPIRRMGRPAALPRAGLGLPAGFMFLFTFDFLSVFERKNPVAVIEAFQRAFRENEGPVLVIKSINGHGAITSMEMMKIAAANRDDIKIVDGYLTADDQVGLIASCDCYVSLHRAEGYGLGMAEAMALGKPIIATGYSGNLEFLNQENSYLVGYQMTSIPKGAGPYPETGVWADPDIEEAATLMRRVYTRKHKAGLKGRRARRNARRFHTAKRTAVFIRQRIDEITAGEH